MKIQRFTIPGLAQYSYVVSSRGCAAVVDPIRDIDRYLEYAAAEHLRVTCIVETHIHADFASGATSLAAATGAELALSAHAANQHYQYLMPHRALAGGESIRVGEVRIEALHTPGHTPEHLSFVVFDEQRSASEPVALLAGDFLFVGSLGRPDLLGEAEKLGLARELFHSLHRRIAHLSDGVQLLPGHGAGSLCGAGMSERAESTLGYERATNPLFGLDEADFINEILRSVPPMPTYYPHMKLLNAHGAPHLASLPGGNPLSAKEVAQLAEQPDTVLLDLRRQEAFGGAHIKDAINIGAGQNLSLWAGWMLDPNKRIVLIGEHVVADSARRSLIRVGLDNITGFLAGGMAAWIDSGRPFERTTQLSASEVAQALGGSLLIDVRSPVEWERGHISGARHIMLGDLNEQLADLPRSLSIVTVCGSGYRSSLAASLLKQQGFRDVSSMHGGMSAWLRQQLAVTR